MTQHFDNVSECVDKVIEELGNEIVLATPLGLGKANIFLNALYDKVKNDPSLNLKIYTALSLEIPKGKSGLEKRFLEPFTKRVFKDYPELNYMKDLRSGDLPSNIFVSEFYVKSASILGIAYAQQNYCSTNYTHVARNLIQNKINLLVQMLSKRDKEGDSEYSMSCNPEVSLELLPYLNEEKQKGRKTLFIGQVHPSLPFMTNDAMIKADDLDMIIENPEDKQQLFAPPDMPVSLTDYLIGLHASSLIPDGGTLQLGISSLSDAIVYGCQLRHSEPENYKNILKGFNFCNDNLVQHSDVFDKGLYANSEMFVDGFMDLFLQGILKRKVYDNTKLQEALNNNFVSETITAGSLEQLHKSGVIQHPLKEEDVETLVTFGVFKKGTYLSKGKLYCPNGKKLDPDFLAPSKLERIVEACLGRQLQTGVVLHGGFFLGPQLFYDRLNNLTEDEKNLFNMTTISYVNNLYGQEKLKRAQRIKARFINTIFKASLLGAATSDALEDGSIVSGVGGQYNFVAQAHELEDARSILVFKSTYTKKGIPHSNIVFNYAHCTIPRHLRDIFITEYGIADLRGKSDADCIKAMLNICDSRFQEKLMQEAKESSKLENGYQIPEQHLNNYKEAFRTKLKNLQKENNFPSYPFGTDFTQEEQVLLRALKGIKKHSHNKLNLVGSALMNLATNEEKFKPYLKRMKLDKPENVEEKLEQALLISALKKELD